MAGPPHTLEAGPDSYPEAGYGRPFLSGPAALAAALSCLAVDDAASLPLLAAADRVPLIEAAGQLPYRVARAIIGEGEQAVHQDFELCMSFPPDSPFRGFATALERLMAAALARLDPAPLDSAPPFNDLIVQRYPAGSAGITPHRDHIRYRGLVAIVTLSGWSRFFVCSDRGGRDAREIPQPPGSLLLMRAPGFAGRSDRPFHLLTEVSEERLSLGLRHDVKAE